VEKRNNLWVRMMSLFCSKRSSLVYNAVYLQRFKLKIGVQNGGPKSVDGVG
jgi:hypothetical protein